MRLRDRPRVAIAPSPGTPSGRARPEQPAAAPAAAGGVSGAVEAHLIPPLDPAAAAFFDLDNTIVRGASLFHYARGLAAHRFVTVRDVARFAWQQTCFRLCGAENAGHMSDARQRGLSLIQGRKVADFTAIADDIFDRYLAAKIWPGARALAQMHLDAGQRVWLVTAAPVEIAQTIADRLGLTGALGTVCEAADGVYTGRLAGDLLHGTAKAAAVRDLAVREGIDLAKCAAYSDSSNDIPMLTLVGYPCAINPDGELLRHARSRGWRTRDFRTGRRAARIGVPTAAGVGAVTGAVVAGLAYRKRRAAS